MISTSLSVSADRGALSLNVDRAGARRALRLSQADGLPDLHCLPARWAASQLTAGLLDPVGWLSEGGIRVEVAEGPPPSPQMRAFAVSLVADAGRTPLRLSATAEVPVLVARGVGLIARALAAGPAEATAG